MVGRREGRIEGLYCSSLPRPSPGLRGRPYNPSASLQNFNVLPNTSQKPPRWQKAFAGAVSEMDGTAAPATMAATRRCDGRHVRPLACVLATLAAAPDRTRPSCEFDPRRSHVVLPPPLAHVVLQSQSVLAENDSPPLSLSPYFTSLGT